MPHSLILTGGGARGAFQVGVLKAANNLGISYRDGFGVSTGALNINHALRGEILTLESLWRGIRESDVHRTFNAFKTAWRLAAERKRGIYDNTPLKALIERHIPSHPHAYAGYVSLRTGQYYCRPATHDAIYASATMPIVWAPVEGDLVDGGVRRTAPISDAIDKGATSLIIVGCRPKGVQNMEWRSSGRFLLLADALRTIELLTDEVLEGNQRELHRINRQIDRGMVDTDTSGRPYHRVRYTVIRPERWIGETLSFDQSEISEAISHGYEVGSRALESYLEDANASV